MALCMQVYHADGTQGLPKDASGGSVGWSEWHWMRFIDARNDELGTPDDYKSTDEYVFTQDHEYSAPETDIWSRGGEPGINYTLTIRAGDVFRMWRDR